MWLLPGGGGHAWDMMRYGETINDPTGMHSCFLKFYTVTIIYTILPDLTE